MKIFKHEDIYHVLCFYFVYSVGMFYAIWLNECAFHITLHFKNIYWCVLLLCRVANYCLKLASEQEKVVSERWLPELRTVVQEARRCFEDCQRIRGLVSEYYISFISLCSCLCQFSKISIIWLGYSIYGLHDIKHTSNFQAIAFNSDHIQFCLCFPPS
jgi:hypothetical protein